MVKSRPQIVIFDVDGVLVDVHGSFHKSVLDTVHHFTGRRFRDSEVLQWKNKSGYNDDWKLSTDWICSLGTPVEYEEVKAQFQRFYWGRNGKGNVAQERWLVPLASLRRLAGLAELGIFTGRTRRELRYTLERMKVRRYFRKVVTLDDVAYPKPNPEGLLRILEGRDTSRALYLGDNVDDANAARSAGIPFLGVLPKRSVARRTLGPTLSKLGALDILDRAVDVVSWLR